MTLRKYPRGHHHIPSDCHLCHDKLAKGGLLHPQREAVNIHRSCQYQTILEIIWGYVFTCVAAIGNLHSYDAVGTLILYCLRIIMSKQKLNPLVHALSRSVLCGHTEWTLANLLRQCRERDAFPTARKFLGPQCTASQEMKHYASNI